MSHLPLPEKPQTLPPATQQQTAIIGCAFEIGESIKVDAGAGTGKTTTLVHFAQSKRDARLLYICYNNRAVAEAAAKFAACGIHNTVCSTVHGLARETKALYTASGKFQNRIHLKDLRIELDCKHAFAWRVQNALHRFYQSADTEINESHCSPRKKSKTGEEEHIGYNDEHDALTAVRTGLLRATRRIWEKTKDPEDKFPISFDGYLKAYQLQQPRLNYDYILLDESQDSNPLTLSILTNQQEHCRIVLVGDENQALYGFREAVNAMEHWKSKRTYPLNESFRFGKNIAACANLILGTFLNPDKQVIGLKPSDSLGKIPRHLKHTFLSRTNSRLIEEALQYVASGRKIHFVGTRADNLWNPMVPYKFNDVLDAWNLSKGEKGKIRSPYFQNFESYQELEALAKGAVLGENSEGETIQGDKELEALCRMVNKHKENLPAVIDKIIEASTSPQEAAVLLSTTHRSKGLEFKRVRMADDFTDAIVTDMEVDEETKQPIPGTPRLAIPGKDVDAEEFNILYVAITRASERLEICPQLEMLLNHQYLLPKPELGKLNIEEEADYKPSEGEDIYISNSPGSSPQGKTTEGNKTPELKIPFADKDIAKELAIGGGGRLLWNPTRKTWRWSPQRGQELPVTLKRYLV